VQARIHRLILIAEVLDELESQQISVEAEAALHVFHVDDGMIESKFPVSIWSGVVLFKETFFRVGFFIVPL
jgi:hypothetical protein